MAGRFSVDAIFKAIDRLTRPVAQMQSRMERFQRRMAGGFRGANRMADQFFGKMKTGGLIVGGAAVAGGAGLALLAKAGMDFEQAITNVAAVSLLTRKEIPELEKKALELGATTKFTATQAAEGMELMARAGFTTQDILSGIGGVLNAAAAEGAELAEISGHVSNVLKGMGMETSEATRVADVLALASARTNSSISSLGESMSNVASTARQFKIPLEDTVAAVALLQDVGLDASVAGSALNTMLTQLANPTDAIVGKMKKFGVTFQDAAGNMLPLQEVMANMAKAAQESGGNMDQVAFFAELVGLRGQKAAANLKDLFLSGKFGELAKELQNAKGSAEKMAATRMDTLGGDLLLLESAVDAVKVALFDTQSGPLRDIVQGMTKWVDANKGLIKTKFVEFVKESTALLVAFGKGAKKGFDDVKPVLLAVSGAFGKLFGGDSKTRLEQAGTWGERLTKLAFALTGLAVATKAANAAIVLFGLVTKAGAVAGAVYRGAVIGITAAVGFYNLATKIGVAATIALTFHSKLAKVEMVAGTVATWARVAAQKIYNLVVGLGSKALALFQTATIASTAKTVAGTAANYAAAVSFRAMAAAAGAAGAAVAAVMLAIDQNEKLKKETGGLGLLDIGAGMIEQGTLDPFKVVDKHMDDQARLRAHVPRGLPPKSLFGNNVDPLAGLGTDAFRPPAGPAPGAAPQTVGAEEQIMKLFSEKKDSLELTVKAPPDTAEVTRKPKKTSVRFEPSGAF